MNNATVALNVARPVSQAPTSASAATAKANDDTTPSKRFDAVLDNARTQTHAGTAVKSHATDSHASTRSNASSDTHKAKDDHADDGNAKTTTSTKTDDGKVASAKTDKTADQDDAKKDDTSDDDGTSIASTMLALIGVPPKVTELASKTLGALKGAAGKTGDLTAGALAMGLPNAAAAAATGGDGKGAMLASTEGAGALADATASTAAGSPLAALLAARTVTLGAGKDDATTPSDPTTSPMPLTHTPGLAPVDGTVMQVQATQAATSPQFAQELGEQIAWMGSGEVKEARIKLHPEELGSMDVRVNVDGGKVNVAIMAQHPAAVHAVQQTLSQLDTMLAHHGLSLGQADVGQQQAGQGNQEAAGNGGSGQGGADDSQGTSVTLATSRVSRGLVDEVA